MSTITDKLAEALRALLDECDTNAYFANEHDSERGAMERAETVLGEYDARRTGPSGPALQEHLRTLAPQFRKTEALLRQFAPADNPEVAFNRGIMIGVASLLDSRE